MGEKIEIQLEPRPLPAAGEWGVAWTKSRCEKSLEEYLRVRETPCFLPVIARRRVYGKRVRLSQLPLFSGYVFYDLTAIPRQQLFDSRKVVQVLASPDPELLRQELANLNLALGADTDLRATRIGPPGRLVRIRRGPLEGLQGELVRLENAARLIVRISFLACAAELEIDEAFVEPI